MSQPRVAFAELQSVDLHCEAISHDPPLDQVGVLDSRVLAEEVEVRSQDSEEEDHVEPD